MPTAEPPIWGALRGPGNRSAIDGGAREPARESLVTASGADVRFARRIAPEGHPAVLVHGGTMLAAISVDGRELWRRADLAIERVVGVADSAGPHGIALVVSGHDALLLLDLADGAELWRFDTPERYSVSGVGSVRLVEHDGELLLLVAPGYSTSIHCFELSDPRHVRLRWRHELGSSIDAGFGPVLIIADVRGRGRPELVLSSRRGSSYEDDDSEVVTERLVLGRRDGHLYQAVHDLDDGRLLADVSYRPDSGPYPAARPYGLLTTSGGPQPDIVLVSCQVEEYVSVTATAGGLARRWGWFVEKDWPLDEQELRPQTSSVADVLGDGRPRLVVGHWDGAWTTLILDVLGAEASGTTVRLPGRYFWGCADLDGDGVPEIITSFETERRPSGRATIEAVDARTGAAIATAASVRLVTSDDEDLPPDLTFHAERRSAAILRGPGGRLGLVLVGDDGRSRWWSPRREAQPETRELCAGGIARIDDRPGGPLATTDDGTVLILDEELAIVTTLGAEGRTAMPLLWSPDGIELVADHASGRTTGWRAGGSAPVWELAGDRASLHRDSAGEFRVATAETLDHGTRVRLARRSSDGIAVEWEAVVDAPVASLLCLGDEPHVLVAEQLGPHTARLRLLGPDGAVLWRDEARGAHASQALASRQADGRWLVAHDDHGFLMVRDALSGTLLHEEDWTAAYTTPMLVEVDGREVLVRADGIHGVETIELDGTQIWRRSYDVFMLHPGVSAVTRGPRGPLLAVPRRDGWLDILDLRDGALLASHEIGAQARRKPVLGLDGLVAAGMLDGSLRALEPLMGTVRWERRFPAAVEAIAGCADDEGAAIAVATADGRLHLLEEHPR